MSEIKAPKISIIMQCLLSDYPGSRINSTDKFKRAVDSFKNQIYKNCELIIVADNCELTKKVFQENYSEEENIKFIFYHRNKNDKKMYENSETGEKVFRGFARQVGRGAVTGELTTYMDSDDVLSPKFTYTILLAYNLKSDAYWWINNSWYDNFQSNWPDSQVLHGTIGSEEVILDYIESKWNIVKVKSPYLVMTPWLLTHKSDCLTKWKDTYGVVSEDSDFSTRLRSEYKSGSLYERPIYVRCHYSNKWDI
jgi:hypothetical protein